MGQGMGAGRCDSGSSTVGVGPACSHRATQRRERAPMNGDGREKCPKFWSPVTASNGECPTFENQEITQWAQCVVSWLAQAVITEHRGWGLNNKSSSSVCSEAESTTWRNRVPGFWCCSSPWMANSCLLSVSSPAWGRRDSFDAFPLPLKTPALLS